MAKSEPIQQGPQSHPKKAQSGLTKPMNLSPELQDIIGPGPMSRAEVIKALWMYIKEHKLQDENDKRTIIADEKLKKIFEGQAKVNMFEMTKLVSKHLSYDDVQDQTKKT